MSSTRKRTPKNYGVIWDDLRPWFDQLVEEHGLHCRVSVELPWSAAGIHPAVVVEAVRHLGGGAFKVEVREYRRFDSEAYGSAEATALQLVSMMLLTLSHDLEQAERQAILL